MKHFLPILMMLGLSQAQSDLLSAYQWENRLIVLFAPNEQDALYQDQKTLLDTYQEDLLERDLLIFSVFETSGYSQEAELSAGEATLFRERFDAGEGFTFVLIGKDSGVKRKQNELVTLEDLFTQIDAMPMRIREMNED